MSGYWPADYSQQFKRTTQKCVHVCELSWFNRSTEARQLGSHQHSEYQLLDMHNQKTTEGPSVIAALTTVTTGTANKQTPVLTIVNHYSRVARRSVHPCTWTPARLQCRPVQGFIRRAELQLKLCLHRRHCIRRQPPSFAMPIPHAGHDLQCPWRAARLKERSTNRASNSWKSAALVCVMTLGLQYKAVISSSPNLHRHTGHNTD